MIALKLQDVYKGFGEKTAVNRISFEVNAGEIYGLLGANGAGKTTTMRMVLGLLYPDEGEITYQGKPYSEKIKRQMGYLPEERGLYTRVKICDQLLYFASLRGMHRVDAEKNLKEWLSHFNILQYYHNRVEELSKGNQQKIQFIASVIHHPQLLVLDEAFSGLDPVNVELLKDTVKMLRDQGTCILFSTHRMEHVEELCQNLTILHRSKAILQGKVQDIKQKYSRDRVILQVEGNVEGFSNITGVKVLSHHAQNYEFHISHEACAQEILSLAMSQGVVKRFELKEPTLNEIFVKEVGESL